MNLSASKSIRKENSTNDNLNEEENKHVLPMINLSQEVSQELEREDQKEGGEDLSKEEKEVPKEEKDEEYYAKLQEEKLKKELTELSKDMWFTKLIVTRTWIVPTVTGIIMFSLVVLNFILGGFALSDEHDRDFQVWSSQVMKNWDKLELAKEKVSTNFPDNIQPLRTSVIRNWVTSLTFECTD